MDKTAIRNFAIEARKILMKSAITEAGFYGITKDGCKSPIQKGNDFEVYETLAGTENRIYGDDIKRRANLVKAIEEQGFDQVIEETAYTWFNRIIAIRFMEVNNYLPTRVRVLSSETGSGTPDIITQADTVELNLTADELDKIQTAKRENKYDEAFRLLFVKQCNELNEILPGLFEKTNDYMELLLKITYTGDGVVRMLVDTIPEDNFNVETEGQVEIIGWMYQYYNTELKDDTFAKLKKNVKITKERIPAATQLFTPDWIVRYMVENSLGRVWIEHLRALDPSLDEKAKAEEFGWKYYLPEAEQEDNVAAQLVEIRQSYRDLTPQDITCIDPCMGSGHILVYMFDVLMDIYRSEGFSEREAVFDVLEKNIRGLDIDRRAYQLSYFALMMKARGYNRIFFRGRENMDGERVQAVPQVYAIEESNNVNRNQFKYFGENLSDIEKNDALNQLNGLLDQLIDAKEYGSILNVEKYNWDLLSRFVDNYSIPGQMNFEMVGIEENKRFICRLVNQAKTMAEKYWVVSTNPPYMGAGGMGTKISEFVKKQYPNSKTDLFAVFIEKCRKMTRANGIQSMITQHAWMFLSSYEKLRTSLRDSNIINMAHLGPRAFEEIGGEVVQTTSFVFRHDKVEKYRGYYKRLVEYSSQTKKEEAFLATKDDYYAMKEAFATIPNQVYAYWTSETLLRAFAGKQVKDYGNACIGMRTGDNERFLRLWFEVDYDKVGLYYCDAQSAKESQKKWFPYCKGGSFRKWYGNNDYVVNWENDGYEIKENTKKVYPQLGDNLGWKISNEQYYFMPGLTWSGVGANIFGVRSYPNGMIFDSGANSYFVNSKEDYYYFAGLLNTKLIDYVIKIINPTINTGSGVIAILPAIMDEKIRGEVEDLVKENIRLSKEDWDSFETSWEFKKHPLVRGEKLIEDAFLKWKDECEKRFSKLKWNEERINQLFCELYGMETELSADVDEENVTVRKADLERDLKSLISYAVGCMFGRYSIDSEGVLSNNDDMNSFVDVDNIIPITDEEYFEDDIVTKFVEWIGIVFGEENIEDNISFITSSLGLSGNSNKDKLRNYFLNDFYKDHCTTYSVTGSGKRPIYWMFSSGKQNGFKCLMYIHRYTKDTVGLIRSDYLTKAQEMIENANKNAEYVIQSTSSAVDRAQATKKKDKYIKQLAEIKYYYQALSHVGLMKIDLSLDDGIKANYAKFQGIEVSNEGEKKQTIDLLAKI